MLPPLLLECLLYLQALYREAIPVDSLLISLMRDYGIADEHHEVVASCFPSRPPQARHLWSILILLYTPFHIGHIVIMVGDDPALVKLQDRGSVSADRVQG
jgi:hypothetical protein